MSDNLTTFTLHKGPDGFATVTRAGAVWAWEVRIGNLHFSGTRENLVLALNTAKAKLAELAPSITPDLEL